MIAPAEIVAVEDVAKVVWASLAAGVGVTLVFSLAIYGSTRFGEFRREERTLEAAFAGLLAAAGMAAVLAVVAAGIYVLTS